MKSSEYNYYIAYNQGVTFMNGISEASFWVESKFADEFREIIENPDAHAEHVDFLSKMKVKGFIIDDDTDEKELIDQKYKSLRMPHEYRIMILPTYQCNLRCWYCVQDHQNCWLTEDNVERVKNLIRNRLAISEIKRLFISWFGGEPLMAYDTLLGITKFAQELTKSNNQEFLCGITTNGTLLTPERIHKLHEAGVTHYQITIDGEKAVHDQVKQLGKLSAFDTTLKNVSMIAEHTQCILRFNYTKDTFNPDNIVRQIEERIPQGVRHNITFNLQQVWQSIGIEKIDMSEVTRMMDLLKDIGIVSSLKPCGLCYVDHKYYDCVYPSGVVGKCENGITDMKHAKLNDDGSLDLSVAETSHYQPTYEREDNNECHACKYFPFCWGPCSQKRYLQLKHEGRLHCVWPDKEETMAELICNRHLNNINNQ